MVPQVLKKAPVDPNQAIVNEIEAMIAKTQSVQESARTSLNAADGALKNLRDLERNIQLNLPENYLELLNAMNEHIRMMQGGPGQEEILIKKLDSKSSKHNGEYGYYELESVFSCFVTSQGKPHDKLSSNHFKGAICDLYTHVFPNRTHEYDRYPKADEPYDSYDHYPSTPKPLILKYFKNEYAVQQAVRSLQDMASKVNAKLTLLQKAHSEDSILLTQSRLAEIQRCIETLRNMRWALNRQIEEAKDYSNVLKCKAGIYSLQINVNAEMSQIYKAHGIINDAENVLQANSDSLAEVKAYCEMIDEIMLGHLNDAQAASRAVQEVSHLMLK